MHAGIVQKIFNDHFDQYRRNTILSLREHSAAWSIMTCRTEDQGYHIDACPNGDYRQLVYNSCKIEPVRSAGPSTLSCGLNAARPRRWTVPTITSHLPSAMTFMPSGDITANCSPV